jgi:hypothetical protein
LDNLIPLWEHTLLRFAGFCIAAGVIGRYILYPVGRAARTAYRRGKKIVGWIERVNDVVLRELTDDGNGSMKNKVDALHDQIGTVTTDVAQVRDDLTSQHASLTEKIDAVTAQADRLEQADEHAEAAWLKWIWEHRKDHTDLHRWLADTFGVDRRGSPSPFDPETDEPQIERRGD